MAGWTLKAPQRWPVCGLAYLKNKSLEYSLNNARQLPRSYQAAPRLDGDHVRATLTCFDARHPKHSPPGPQQVDLLVRRIPRQTLLQPDCSCGQYQCVHVFALLGDLATWPEFAHALVTGRDTTPYLSALDARRLGNLNSAAVEARLGAWTRVPAARAVQPVRYVVLPRWVGADWDGEAREDSRPGLEVEAYVGTRTRPLTSEDLWDAPISVAERELLELCAPVSRGVDLVAVGSTASRVLSLLETRDVSLLGGETRNKNNTPLRFETWRVAPRVMKRRVSSQWIKGEAAAEDAPSMDALVAEWATPDGSVVSPMNRTMYFPGQDARVVLLDRQCVVHVAPGVDPQLVMHLQRQPVVKLDATVTAAAVWGALKQAWSGRGVTLPALDVMDVGVETATSIWLALDGTPLLVEARLVAEYPFGAFDLRPEQPVTDLRRDKAREDAALAAVADAGLKWDDAQRIWLAQEDDAAALWLHGIARLEGVEVRVSQALGGVTVRGPVRAKAAASMVDGMLDVSLVLHVNGLRADMEDVRRALRAKRSYARLVDGTLARLQDTVQGLLGEIPELLTAGPVVLPQQRVLALYAWLQHLEEVTLDAGVKTWKERLDRGAPKHAELPESFSAQLSKYQEQGLAWLQWLTAVGAGGILADDMGLGKTVQALAWLSWLKQRPAWKGPALVVCPTSVTHHWLAEAARFAPGLRVALWHGEERTRTTDALHNVDVLVTTYGVLRQDAVWLSRQTWSALVLDEAQQLKNADAFTTRVVRQISAPQRLALSGTPLENRVMDLWTLMDLVNPGMLGPRARFEAVVEPSIMREPGGWHARDLVARVTPFLLRRTKAAVLTQLPPKTEQDLHVLPTRQQRGMYDAVAALARKDVARALARQGSEQARMTVLAAITRLRQVALDPRLLDPTVPAEHGAKRTEFLALVERLVAQGRRALVFSSFVELLTLWRRDLADLGVHHGYLDGATTRREAVVQRFQEGDAPLLLVSLKAGGTGLNLTGADTVILTDPWWNPAVEDQAAGRAHRMGQTRAVTVYRLITRGTVEERMVQLKARKRALADALLMDSVVPVDTTDTSMLLADCAP